MASHVRSYTKLSANRRAAFLDQLATCGNVTAAADSIGVSRDAVYKLRDRDEAFEENWLQALDRYSAALEAELHLRIFEGLKRPIFQRGELVGHELTKSDRLLEIALRARMPEKYSERVAAKLEHSGATGVIVVPGTMAPADWVAAFKKKSDDENASHS